MGEVEAVVAAMDPTGEAETSLVRGLREGAAEAHAALYERFAAGLHRYAVTRLHGDAQTAEDLVVDALAAAARDIRRFNPKRASFSAWVYGIARRRVLLELRLQARQKSVPRSMQVPLTEAPGGADAAARAAERLEARRQVEALFGALSEAEMEVLILASVRELSVREIARIVDRSEPAVHSLLHRARQKARERLERDG